MSSPGLSTVEGTTIRLAPTVDGSVLTVVLSGSADLTARPILESFLKDLHTAVTEQGLSRVVMDVHQLTFMNSSCIKEFLTWLKEIRQLEPPHRYEVQFSSNPMQPWQKRTLQNLRATADGVTVLVT